jgi:cation-transporting ATPase 13A3/4/5
VPVYSCSESFSLSVNIHNFNADNKTDQSAEACSHAANLTNIPTWSSSPEVAMWLECPTPDYGQLTFGEDVFIALFTYYGSCLVLLVGWSLLKYIREKVSDKS